MKRFIFISVFILTGVTSVCAQHACCQPADQAFAGLADDPRFVMQHDEPVPVTLHVEAGTMVSFPTADGKDARAYVVRPDQAGSNFLIVFHEWWGLNDHIIQMADQLAADLKDVTVIAVDLYDGQVAATREDAASAMQSMSTERGIHIIRGVQQLVQNQYTDEQPTFATIGWCMGGGWSLQAALEYRELSSACVIYYGMPESDADRLSQLECPVLFVFAKQDKWISYDVVSGFKKNMLHAGKKLRILEYDADHAFANPSNPGYNNEAALEAYAESLSFLYTALH